MQNMLKLLYTLLKGMNFMELLQLKYFCFAAQSENFSVVAKKFNVPTSNISQSIKRLEKELCHPLFTRTSNTVKLNERGRTFYNEVKTALDILNHAKADILGNKSENMKIGIFANRRIAMNAVEKFQKLYPEISIIVSHEWNPLQNDYDLIVSDGTKEIPNLNCQKFYQEKLMLATPKGYFNTDKLTADDIKDKPFVTMSSGWSLHNMTQKVCKDMGFSPRIALQSDDPFYIRKCIELGLGISIVSEFSWRGQFSRDIELINIGDYKRDIYIHLPQKTYIPWYVDKFHSILLASYKEESSL